MGAGGYEITLCFVRGENVQTGGLAVITCRRKKYIKDQQLLQLSTKLQVKYTRYQNDQVYLIFVPKSASNHAPTMAILLTGGKGKTSMRVAGILKNAKIPFIMTSRRGGSGSPDTMPVAKLYVLFASSKDSPVD